MRKRAEKTKTGSTTPAVPSVVVAARSERQHFEAVFTQLDKSVNRSRSTATLLLIVAVLLGCAVFVALAHSTGDALDRLEADTKSPQIDSTELGLVVFYMSVRATALAGFGGAVVYGLFNLARAALDQATRFEKRLLASHLMRAMLDRYDIEDQAKTPLSIRDVIDILGEWSKSVDSAYTNVKFGKTIKNSQITVGPDGAKMDQSDTPTKP